MLKHTMRLLRSHPILLAGLVGAVAGCVNVIVIEATAVMHGNGRGVLPLLFSSSAVSSQIGHTSALQIALLLLIEVAGNVAGFVLLFVVPAALVLGLVRIFQRRKTDAVP